MAKANALTDAVADVISAYIRDVALHSNGQSRVPGRSKTTFYDVYNMVNTISFLMQSSVRAIIQHSSIQRVKFPIHVLLNPNVRPPSSASMP